MTLIRFCAVLVFVGLAACGGCEDTPQTNDGGPVDAASDLPRPDVATDVPPQVCTPGEIGDCREENTPAVDICNAGGTAFEPGSCPARHVCRSGECVEVNCIPDTRRCKDTRSPQICDEAGDRYVDLDECGGGSRCEEGNCLDRCQIAEVTNSYIGCEYWAVELENHLLNDSDSPLPEHLRPPYAIVLANTSTTYDAGITVYSADGTIATADAFRDVGSDVGLPGIDPVRVFSEVVDANGTKIFEIDGPVDNLPLPRQTTMTLLFSHRSPPFAQTSLTNVGYRVVSTQPVVAYQFNPLCCNYNFTNDASLLLPTSALTENYMFMSYAVWAGLIDRRLAEPMSPTLTVIATQPDTRVDVLLRPSRDVNRTYEQIIYPVTGGRIDGPNEQGVLTVTMQPHEVLNVAGAGVSPVEDLTGAFIRASKPVAVFGGHSCADVPFSNPACDHLESQLFPLETWGRRFVAAPLKSRLPPNPNPNEPPPRTREGTYWKFLAYQDGTVIDVKMDIRPPNTLPPADEGVRPCTQFAVDAEAGTFQLNRGESCEFGSTQAFVAEATNPIMIGAFLSGQNSVKVDAQFGDHAGDPAFFLVPPEEQFRTSYSFLTPATYYVSYITVLVRPGFPVVLDGVELDPSTFDYEEIPGQGLARAHIEVDDGPHSIESVVPFGLVVYGYDDYVSYAYTGGLDLTKLANIDF